MTDDQSKLLIERTRKWVGSLSAEARKKPTIFTMSGKTFTPDQVVAEMEKDTPMGKVFKAAEAKMLERTLQSKKKVGL